MKINFLFIVFALMGFIFLGSINASTPNFEETNIQIISPDNPVTAEIQNDNVNYFVYGVCDFNDWSGAITGLKILKRPIYKSLNYRRNGYKSCGVPGTKVFYSKAGFAKVVFIS